MTIINMLGVEQVPRSRQNPPEFSLPNRITVHTDILVHRKHVPAESGQQRPGIVMAKVSAFPTGVLTNNVQGIFEAKLKK